MVDFPSADADPTHVRIDDAGTGDSSMSSADSAEATQVCRAAITALVERTKACLGYDVDTKPYLDACPDYYFNSDSNRTVAAVAACISELTTRPCSELDLNMTAACLSGGKRPGGSGCQFPSQCESNVCSGAIGACSTCRDGNFLPGATCARFQCQPGDFCDEGKSICVAGSTLVHVGEGEPCLNSKTSTVICQGDLHCMNNGVTTTTLCRTFHYLNCPPNQCDADSYCKDSNTGSCAPFAKLGEACSETGLGDLPRCVPPTRCWNGKCARRGTAGENCDANQPCSEYFDCVGGTCRLRVCPA
jgi:hypothetical protein